MSTLVSTDVVPSDTVTTTKRAALRRVAAAYERRETAKRDLRAAVIAAQDAGCSLREIAAEMGMTHAAVRKMTMQQP